MRQGARYVLRTRYALWRGKDLFHIESQRDISNLPSGKYIERAIASISTEYFPQTSREGVASLPVFAVLKRGSYHEKSNIVVACMRLCFCAGRL